MKQMNLIYQLSINKIESIFRKSFKNLPMKKFILRLEKSYKRNTNNNQFTSFYFCLINIK